MARILVAVCLCTWAWLRMVCALDDIFDKPDGYQSWWSKVAPHLQVTGWLHHSGPVKA